MKANQKAWIPNTRAIRQRLIGKQLIEAAFSEAVKTGILLEVAPFTLEDVYFLGRSCKILFVQQLCFFGGG
jgi:hypothetical protein